MTDGWRSFKTPEKAPCNRAYDRGHEQYPPIGHGRVPGGRAGEMELGRGQATAYNHPDFYLKPKLPFVTYQGGRAGNTDRYVHLH